MEAHQQQYPVPGVVLFVDTTAVLKASLNASLYPADTTWPYNAALVVGQYADGAAVAGGGAIDGQAPQFVTSLSPVSDQFAFQPYMYSSSDDRQTDNNRAPFRVRLVEFKHSRNVTVSQITLQDSTSFHVHALNCSGVLVEGITVHSDLRWGSCDGVDITSCNDTVIRGSRITTGDDAISPKTWAGYGPLNNLLIEDVVIHARSGGIHFGASAFYDYVNVTIRRVTVLDSHQGVLAQVRGPGSIRGLAISQMLVTRASFNAPCVPWMGNAHPIALSADRWRGGPADRGPVPVPRPGTITNVTVQDLTAQSENGIFISGRVGGVSDVRLEGVRLLVQHKPANNGSWGPCNSHNYWPTSGPGGEKGIAAPIDGVFVEHADNVVLSDLSVAFVGKPKPGSVFGRCVYADPATTTGVVQTGAQGCSPPL
eukprot:g2649.t1